MYKVVELKGKESISEEFKAIAGVKLWGFESKYSKGELIILGALSLEDNEKFYKSAYEQWGKRYIDEDYKKFLEYCISDDFEGSFLVKLDDLKSSKEAKCIDLIIANKAHFNNESFSPGLGAITYRDIENS